LEVGAVRVQFKPIYVALAGIALLCAGLLGVLYVVADVDHKGSLEAVHGTILTMSVLLVALGTQLLALYVCAPDDPL
jgi:hypothetical protein